MPYSLHCFIFLFAFGQAFSQNTVKWSLGPELPKEVPAVGGAFTGMSDGALVLAGGSFFPDTPPWKGGVKSYSDAIHVLVRGSDGVWKWQANVGKLPSPMAYGASVILPEGVLCIGGCDNNKVFQDVTLLTWNQSSGKMTVKKWPALDTPLMMCAGALAAGKVYVFGGQESLSGEPTSRSKQLDTSLEATSPEFTWQPAPSWEGAARILPVVISHHDAKGAAIWLFSGRGRGATPAFESLTDAWKFKPATGEWKRLADITVADQGARGVIGASACVYGTHILIFGGDDGVLTRVSALMASRILYTDAEKLAWKNFTEALLDKHPGYTSEVLAFDTLSEKWGVATTSPHPLPVTNLAVQSGQDYFLLAGESRPGIRTPQVVISTWPPLPALEQEPPIPKAIPVSEDDNDETPEEDPLAPDTVPPANPNG